jgi:glycosyltransferase involved in cell wall biosynthesis
MPSWSGIADMRRPSIGYAISCRGILDCDMSAVAGRLREGLAKVANVVDICGVPRRVLPAWDAVLATECVTLIPEPYFIYLCPDQATATRMDPVVYERAVGLFAENGRSARWLAEAMGIPSEKIHVIPPAVAVSRSSPHIWPPHLRQAPRRRLLLSLNDGGGQSASDEPVRTVLDVVHTLRQRHDPRIRLTISGLENWPSSGSAPAGVTFRGAPLAKDKMSLFDSHDLLVLPPGPDFDGLPEASSLGLPCVATRTSEMSDAITPGITGLLVEDMNARQLAAAIASVLGNDRIYRNCLERAPAMAAYFSWVRVARQVTHVISREVGLMP